MIYYEYNFGNFVLQKINKDHFKRFKLICPYKTESIKNN